MENLFKAKEPKCPNCNVLLQDVGFKTFEPAQTVFEWLYDGKHFLSHQKENIILDDSEITAECGSCKGELDWGLLTEAGLV